MPMPRYASAGELETAGEQRAQGKQARKETPFEALGVFVESARDATAIIAAQEATRLPHLLDLRRERMSVSPFTFFRGTAAVMAYDLARSAHTGTHLVICGDAHLSNFGFFATPERNLAFDLNDFDEAAPGPWEWDVARLATSIALAAEDRGFSAKYQRKAARLAAFHYRTALRFLLERTHLEKYYASPSGERTAQHLPKAAQDSFAQAIKKARRRTSARAIERFMTTDEHGQDRFIETPPVLTRVTDLTADAIVAHYDQYERSVRPDVSILLKNFALTDVALRVVGVGSVGTRCYVLALTGSDGSHLLLQIKEASNSVIEEHVVPNATTPLPDLPMQNQGQRVVTYQQVLQAASDPFLGHFSNEGRGFYVRQFRDMKGSVELDRLDKDELLAYGEVCAAILARAHAQSPQAHWVGGYLGNSGAADEAFANWAMSYVGQVHRDYDAYLASA